MSTNPSLSVGSGPDAVNNETSPSNISNPAFRPVRLQAHDDLGDRLLTLAAHVSIVAKVMPIQPPLVTQGRTLDIRPWGASSNPLDPSLVIDALRAISTIFQFEASADHVTAAVLQQKPMVFSYYDESGPREWEGSSLLVFIAKNGGIDFSISSDELYLRTALLQWFNADGPFPIAPVFAFCCGRTYGSFNNLTNCLSPYERTRLCEADGSAMVLTQAWNALEHWEISSDHHDDRLRGARDGVVGVLKWMVRKLPFRHNRMTQREIITKVWELMGPDGGQSLRDLHILFSLECSHQTSALRCLDLLEDLSQLPRAIQDLERFKSCVKWQLGATLDIEFIDSHVPGELEYCNDPLAFQRRADELRGLYGLEDGTNPRYQCVSNKRTRVHCEIQLLDHLQIMEPEAQGQVWRYIACSKLPCFCCAVVADCAGFTMEASHCRVYSPWPVPCRVASHPGYSQGLDTLLHILQMAIETSDFRPLRSIPETPRRLDYIPSVPISSDIVRPSEPHSNGQTLSSSKPRSGQFEGNIDDLTAFPRL